MEKTTAPLPALGSVSLGKTISVFLILKIILKVGINIPMKQSCFMSKRVTFVLFITTNINNCMFILRTWKPSLKATFSIITIFLS